MPGLSSGDAIEGVADSACAATCSAGEVSARLLRTAQELASLASTGLSDSSCCWESCEDLFDGEEHGENAGPPMPTENMKGSKEWTDMD